MLQPQCVKDRLTLWAVIALAVTSIASAVTCVAYSSRVAQAQAVAEASATDYEFNIGILLPLLIPYLFFLVALVLFFRYGISHLVAPFLDLTQRCREISINNLSFRFSGTGCCEESKAMIAEYNAMLDRLESGVKKIRQFSGDASHELRTPLTILRGETEVGLRWAKTTEEMHSILQSNMEEIERMGRIIEDLLTLAKSESGQLPLAIRQFSFSDLLQELYLQGRTLAVEKNIEVTLVHRADSEILIRGDDLRLRQLFLNLITNAIRYTHDNGMVTIDVDRQDTQVIVKISDNGIGISAEHLPHIFDRFYRTDEARNRSTGGSGLGLAIVKWIVDAHNATIKITSTPNVGSTFTVSLPIDGPKMKIPAAKK